MIFHFKVRDLHNSSLKLLWTFMSGPAESETDYERQPLLTKDDDPSDLKVNITSDERPERRSRWTIAWFISLTVSGLLLLAVFVRGFIDADDVDVRDSCATSALLVNESLLLSS